MKNPNGTQLRGMQPFAILGTIWFAIVAVDLVLGCLTPGSAVRNYDIPFLARLALVCTNALVVGVVVLAIGVPAVLTRGYLRRHLRSAFGEPTDNSQQPERRHAGRSLFQLLAAVGVFVIALVYLTSWSIFRDTGQFLDHNSILMSQADPLGMFLHALHMRPWGIIFGCMAALAIAAAACVVVPKVRQARTLVGSAKTAETMRYLIILVFVGAVWGYLVPNQSRATRTDVETGIVSPLSDVYSEARDNRVGPLSHGVADLRELWGQLRQPSTLVMPDFSDPLQPNNWRIRRPRQITVDQYHALAADSEYRPHNVIILLVESLRPDQLRSYGGTRNVMPNVDRVAAESLVFTNAYTQASHSNYADMCPLSSHYPLRENGIHVYPRQPQYPRVLIYDLLKPFGYRTAVFSSQNENWGQMINYLSTRYLDRLMHADNYSGPTYICPEDVGFFEWVQGGKKCGKIDDRLTVDEAMQWIDEDQESPFCMYVNLQNSHIPYVVPPDFPRRFSQSAPDFTIGFNNYPEEKTEQVRDAYADSLAYVDHQIGRLVDFLKRNGQWEKTVLVISGDTGQAFYEHGFAAHANKLYNEVMRVPLIIHAPQTDSKIDERLAQHVDVPPTVLALLNLPEHPGFQGHSLVGDPSLNSAVFLVVQSPLANQVALVRDDHKLIFDVGTGRFHLYDLAADPEERHDVAVNQREITREMAIILRQWCRLQLDYYADPVAQEHLYPPVLELD